MHKVLTIDDSRAVRMLVSKQARELGCEVDEAEDGAAGLVKLAAQRYGLIVLDVTMPVLDGPGMLASLRERGDRTPVLVLTSESKRSVVAGLLKLGIADYILKPFRAEELQNKMMKILGDGPRPEAGAVEAVAAGTSSSTSSERLAPVTAEAERTSGKPASDVLVIDDMENVHKRVSAFLPEKISIVPSLTAADALKICRERACRVILVDHTLPDVDIGSFVQQLRVLQPQAAFIALVLRTVNNIQEELRAAGFDGFLYKPFEPTAVEDVFARYFQAREPVAREENVLKVAAFRGREAKLAGYYVQIAASAAKAVEEVAEACYSELIFDMSELPLQADRISRLVVDLCERAKKFGLEVRLVGTAPTRTTLRQLSDTASVPFFDSVAQAQGGPA
jgi:two-component system cell cycle response regulator